MTKNVSKEQELAEWRRVRSWMSEGPTPVSEGPASELERELRAAGIPLQHLWELANLRIVYPAAFPILVEHLQRPYPDYIKQDIIRVLGRREAGEEVHQALLRALRSDHAGLSRQTAFALGNSIAETAPKGKIDTLLEVASNRKYGVAREMPIQRLARIKDTRAKEAVAAFFEEGVNLITAIQALRVAKMWDHADQVTEHAQSDNEYVRTEARRFLKARDKAHSRG